MGAGPAKGSTSNDDLQVAEEQMDLSVAMIKVGLFTQLYAFGKS